MKCYRCGMDIGVFMAYVKEDGFGNRHNNPDDCINTLKAEYKSTVMYLEKQVNDLEEIAALWRKFTELVDRARGDKEG